jgi:hypothetical protein
MTSRRPFAALVCALAVAGPLAGCGNKEDVIKEGDTEGVYLDLGNLRYQVQISRELNPADVEDKAYLTGVSRSDAVLKPGESWFAVFIRVENDHDFSIPSASQFELGDTQGNVYRPVAIARSNPFAYVPERIAGKHTLPAAGSVAQANESINGQLVLFKLKTTSFADRPLELKILGPTVPQDEVTVDIDV